MSWLLCEHSLSLARGEMDYGIKFPYTRCHRRHHHHRRRTHRKGYQNPFLIAVTVPPGGMMMVNEWIRILLPGFAFKLTVELVVEMIAKKMQGVGRLTDWLFGCWWHVVGDNYNIHWHTTASFLRIWMWQGIVKYCMIENDQHKRINKRQEVCASTVAHSL